MERYNLKRSKGKYNKKQTDERVMSRDGVETVVLGDQTRSSPEPLRNHLPNGPNPEDGQSDMSGGSSGCSGGRGSDARMGCSETHCKHL